MKYIFILVGVLGFLPLRAQEYRKTWEEGKLSWADFKGEPIIGSPSGSELAYLIGFDTKKEKFSDTVLYYFKAYSYVDQQMSWVQPEGKNQLNLDYNQALFNLIELYKRKMQQELNRVSYVYEANQVVNNWYSRLRQEQAALMRQTNTGTDTAMVAAWLKKTAQDLENTTVEKIPSFRIRNFGYGLYFGGGYGVVTGSLSDNFSNSGNFVYGFDLAYKRSVLFFNASLGFSKTKKELYEQRFWPRDISSGIAIGEIAYGYQVLDGSKFRVTPYVGLGFVEFSILKDEDRYQDNQLVDSGLMYGLSVDYKIRKLINLVPSFVVKELTDYGIRGRISLHPANYRNSLEGSVVNVSVGVYGFGRFIKTE